MKNSNASKNAADKSATSKNTANTESAEAKVSRKEALVQLRQTLISRRDSIRAALAGDLNLLRELRGQPSGDVVDAALDTAQDEISSQLAEVESRELASIETALERMRDGEYGMCENCNEGIPLARLQALPYAVMCIKCQRKAERNGTAQNGPRDWSRLLDSVSDSDLAADVEVDAG
jgi:DnaK suppressor protein